MTTDTQEQDGRTTTVATPSEREIVSEPVFDAPRELVYRAWTDPDLMSEWWGPRGVTTVADGPEAGG